MNGAAFPIRLVIGSAVVAYTFWFRAHDVTQSFALGGDQIRDWQVALRPLSGLPLSGVSSTAGGNTLGPIYYWVLWVVARVIGPWTEYLPHAGGLGIAALQSFADGVLFLALCNRLRSATTALLLVLLTATSGYDATLSSTIWNPPLAVAFVKVAVAALLWRPVLSWTSTAVAIGASWFAVQCHTSAIVVAGPVITFVMLEPAIGRRWRVAVARLALAAGIILLLQVPWLIETTRTPSAAPSGIIQSVTTVLADPAQSVRLGASANLVVRSLGFILFAPVTVGYFDALLMTTALLTIVLTRDLAVIASSVAPVVTAVAVFSLWQGRLDQAYWFLVLAPSAAIMLCCWIDRMHSRAWLLSLGLLMALGVAQPARANMAWTLHRMPGYGAMAEGCRAIARDGRTVRDVRLAFDLSTPSDPVWLCSIVGVNLGGEAFPLATIDEIGRVRYE